MFNFVLGLFFSVLNQVFQEMRVPCAQVVQRSKILPSLVQLLVQGQEALTACGEVVTPKWLAPLLLLIDLLEKVAMCTQRRDKMYKVSGLEICYTWSVYYTRQSQN
jgi:E3 ubiquitin-protein ligase HUWE1